MDVWGCYAIAMIPMIAAAILWYKHKSFAWWEALVTCGIGLLVAFIVNWIAVAGMTADTETWSGQVVTSVYQPRWQEYYEEAIYRTEYYTETESYTDSKGNHQTRTVTKSRQVFSHWEPRNRWHDSRWTCNDTVNGNFSITEDRHQDIVKKFGGIQPQPGDRRTLEHNSRMMSGDPNDYHAVNKNNYNYPTTSKRSFENKVKAAPSVFSYIEVPKTVNVFEYPSNSDVFVSDRICGQTQIPIEKWDQLNAELGPMKKINLIIASFGPDSDSNMAEFQEAKWIGGKKNDLVICVGGKPNEKPNWVSVFGWTESELVKVNVENLVKKHGLTVELLAPLRQEIIKNYQIKDWSKFDYLTVDIPWYTWIIMFIVVAACTGGFIWFALVNETDQNATECQLTGKKVERPERTWRQRYSWKRYY